MSVLQQLQSTAGQGNGLSSFDEGSAVAQDLMLKMEANPVPGQSLTQDPENRAPWETPPEYVDVQEFVEETLLDLTDPEKMPLLLDALRHEVPVEYATMQYLQRKFAEGVINPDLMMLSMEPVMYLMIHVATINGVDPVLYPEDDMDDGEQLQQNTRDIKNAAASLRLHKDDMISDIERPKEISDSLLDRADSLIKENSAGGAV